MKTLEKLDYEFFSGKRSMSILLFIKNDKQLYKMKSKTPDKIYYVCYVKNCHARVHLLLADNSVVQPKNCNQHSHEHDQESLYKQLKPITEFGVDDEDAGQDIKPNDAVVRIIKPPMPPQWSENDENLLIDIWEEKFFDITQYAGNNSVYEEMALELNYRGVNFTAKQIKMKLNKVFKKYKTEKNKSKKTPSSWPFFARMDAVLNIDGNGATEVESIDSSELEDPLNTFSLSLPQCKLETSDSSLTEMPTIATKRKLSEDNSLHAEILKKIDAANARIELQMNDIRQISRTMLELRKETLIQEQKRNTIFENMAMESLNFKRDLLMLIKESKH